MLRSGDMRRLIIPPRVLTYRVEVRTCDAAKAEQINVPPARPGNAVPISERAAEPIIKAFLNDADGGLVDRLGEERAIPMVPLAYQLRKSSVDRRGGNFERKLMFTFMSRKTIISSQYIEYEYIC